MLGWIAVYDAVFIVSAVLGTSSESTFASHTCLALVVSWTLSWLIGLCDGNGNDHVADYQLNHLHRYHHQEE